MVSLIVRYLAVFFVSDSDEMFSAVQNSLETVSAAGVVADRPGLVVVVGEADPPDGPVTGHLNLL